MTPTPFLIYGKQRVFNSGAPARPDCHTLWSPTAATPGALTQRSLKTRHSYGGACTPRDTACADSPAQTTVFDHETIATLRSSRTVCADSLAQCLGVLSVRAILQTGGTRCPSHTDCAGSPAQAFGALPRLASRRVRGVRGSRSGMVCGGCARDGGGGRGDADRCEWR
jgi:hypothetical protein